MDSVKLFTRQNAKTLSQLEKQGRFINIRAYVQIHLGDIAPYFITKYDWLTREASKRLEKPADVSAPIWCTISPRSCMQPVPGTVVYCLEVPLDKVIFFDNCKWDYVLNQIYLPENDADQQAYNEHLSKLGIPNRFDLTKDKYANAFPEEIARIRNSWIRIFTLDEWDIWNVCGNIWEIRQEWVTDIIKYGDPFDLEAMETCNPGVHLYNTWPEGYSEKTGYTTPLLPPYREEEKLTARPKHQAQKDSFGSLEASFIPASKVVPH